MLRVVSAHFLFLLAQMNWVESAACFALAGLFTGGLFTVFDGTGIFLPYFAVIWDFISEILAALDLSKGQAESTANLGKTQQSDAVAVAVGIASIVTSVMLLAIIVMSSLILVEEIVHGSQANKPLGEEHQKGWRHVDFNEAIAEKDSDPDTAPFDTMPFTAIPQSYRDQLEMQDFLGAGIDPSIFGQLFWKRCPGFEGIYESTLKTNVLQSVKRPDVKNFFERICNWVSLYNKSVVKRIVIVLDRRQHSRFKKRMDILDRVENIKSDNANKKLLKILEGAQTISYNSSRHCHSAHVFLRGSLEAQALHDSRLGVGLEKSLLGKGIYTTTQLNCAAAHCKEYSPSDSGTEHCVVLAKAVYRCSRFVPAPKDAPQTYVIA